MGAQVSEIKRDPIITHDADGNEIVAFDCDHTLADIAQWICQSRSDAEETIGLMQRILTEKYGVVMQ